MNSLKCSFQTGVAKKTLAVIGPRPHSFSARGRFEAYPNKRLTLHRNLPPSGALAKPFGAFQDTLFALPSTRFLDRRRTRARPCNPKPTLPNDDLRRAERHKAGLVRRSRVGRRFRASIACDRLRNALEERGRNGLGAGVLLADARPDTVLNSVRSPPPSLIRKSNAGAALRRLPAKAHPRLRILVAARLAVVRAP